MHRDRSCAVLLLLPERTWAHNAECSTPIDNKFIHAETDHAHSPASGRDLCERRRRTSDSQPTSCTTAANTWPASQGPLPERTSDPTAATPEGESVVPEAEPPLRDAQTVNPAKSPPSARAGKPGTGDPAASPTQHGVSAATSKLPSTMLTPDSTTQLAVSSTI